jgi:ubiquinone/menaquinone biosynthesis C-methylase UbiE
MSESGRVAEFSAVDRAPDPTFAIRFMETARSQPGLRACKAAVLRALRLTPGSAAADVGCGFGTDAAQMAVIVAPGGKIVGIDRSRAMIAAARGRHAHPGLAFQVGDVQALPFPDGVLDACRADTVLQHVPDAGRTLAEMARVVRPGGRVAGFELDLETHAVDSPNRALTRTIVTTCADSIVNGWAGRQLARRYREAGLSEVTMSAHAVVCDFAMFQLVFQPHVSHLCASGAVDEEEAERWWSNLREAERAGRFFSSITGFVVAGTRPG